MKKLLNLFLISLVCAAVVSAQSITLSVSPAAVSAGGTATLTLTFQDSAPTSSIAGFEWTLVLPASLNAGTGTSTITGKVLTSNGAITVDAGTGTTLNVTPFASGTIATFPLTVSATPTPGAQTIGLSGLVAANSSTGSAVSISATATTLTILSKYDLNGDGVVNGLDVTIALQQATGQTACTNGDVNGDGKCNVQDVVIEILASLGLIH